MSTSGVPNHRRRRIVAIAVIVLVAAAAGLYFLIRPPGNVSNPGAAFTAPTTKAATVPTGPPLRDWPVYGYDRARTKWFRGGGALNPPYRRLWSFRGQKLLEFPPTLDAKGLYLLDDGGALRSLDPVSGRQHWRVQLGSLAASTPALHDGVLYAVTLLDRPGAGHGSAFAVRASDGKLIWRRTLPARAESSPLTDGGRVIFGSEDGTVYALDRRNGRTVWSFQADGAVKGGLALSGDRLFFGDYGGSVHAISVRTGKPFWSANPGGTFYSTAAVAWGRVFIGNTDGRLYSYTTGGDLAWARQTGNYVYSSPAIADVPGLGPTVFAGSYAGTFHAWDARNGSSRWTFDAGGKISGGAQVIGDLVWFSDLGNKRNLALSTRTGRQAYELTTGAFNPIVTDGRRLYMIGYTGVFAFEPKR